MLSNTCRFTFGEATINGVLDEISLEPSSDPVYPYDVDATTGTGYHRRYGGRGKDETEGKRLAQVRAEEMMVDRVVVSAPLRAAGIGLGHRFQTSGMPIAELESEYVIVGLETHVDRRSDQASYMQRCESIPSDVAYRAPRLTERPVISGWMHAVVDGEVDGTAAPIDEHGRYKLIVSPVVDANATPSRIKTRSNIVLLFELEDDA